MDHSKYREYSLDELYEALDSVDDENYPAQRKLIELRIEELEGVDSHSELRGIGGWLVLVAIGVLIAPFRMIFSVAPVYSDIFESGTWEAITSPTSEYYNLALATFISAEIIINIILLCISIFLIYLLFTKKPSFPKFFIGITIFSLVFILVDAWVATLLIPNIPMFDPDTINEVARASIGVFIWVPYMLMSKRVKETFK